MLNVFYRAARSPSATAPCRPRAMASLVVVLLCSAASGATPLTLEQAIGLAEQRNPALRSAQAAGAAAEGEWKEVQAPLWNNPQVATETRRRQLFQAGQPDVTRRDSALSFSQTFELGGQQGARRAMAGTGQRAVTANIEDIRREVRAQTEQRFVRLLGLQSRLQAEHQALDLVQQAAELVGKRVKAGEDSKLDGNLARVEAERAANQLAQIEEQLAQARADLTQILQWDNPQTLEAVGDIDAPPRAYTLAALLALAAQRPKMRTLESREQIAKSRLDLERGAQYPDLTVGLAYSPEYGIDGKDRITTLSFSLPLPLFRRNEGSIGRALSELDQAKIEHQAAERNTAPMITTLWAQQESLRNRVARLRQAVIPSLEENQSLSLKALRAGEIGLTQFLLVRRQVLDGQRDMLDALTELRQVQSTLENAAGWPGQLPPLDHPAPGGTP